MREEKNNINFIFGLLDKKKVALCLFIEAFLDFIYYVIPFTFTLFLTMPFTLEKAIMVATIFIASKSIRAFVLYLERKVMDNYLYEYSNVQYLEYYRQLTKVPVETLSKYQTGYLENIIEKISSLVGKILSAEYVGIILSFGFFFYTIFMQSKILFLISLILSILCVLISVYILKKSNKHVEKLYEQEYEYSSVYQDFISNIRTVKALNNNDYFERIIKKEGNECYKKQNKYVKCYSLEEIIRNILILIPFALAVIKGVYDLSNGIDTLGLITFYISLYLEMGFIFDELSGTIVSCFELKALKKKVSQLFNKIDERKILNNFNKIELNNIELKYKESKFNIIVDNLVINQKDKISITGKSGQGKTSIINLILGNISSYKGNITIDNYNIKEARLDIGVVSQEIELFNMSIKDNLCLDKKISDKEIIDYLNELELDEIIMFEDGIYTIVGEKGLKLSTGQKRRINILRSYLMNKDIYILDEPTSNLDKHTEEIVVKFILKYFKDKTLIIATHNEKINEICNKFYNFQNHELKAINGDKYEL
ncbi:MAG: ABC transporter ATP-binding protein [Bacilli bacterium]|nr:ABC transporter ATP-binding protein [Bacilli bacterium]